MELEAARLLPGGFRILERAVDVGVSELVARFLVLILEIALEQFHRDWQFYRTTLPNERL